MSTAPLHTVESIASTALDSHELLRKIFEHSYDAIFVLDPASDAILDANPRACALLGYTRDELLALPISVMHPADLPRLVRFTESARRDGDGLTGEFACRTKSGRSVPVEISSSRIELDGRSCLVCLARDVSERKRSAEELRRAHERLRRGLVSAARIQESLLPERPPEIPDVRTAWVFRPCEELAGDNLGVFRLDDDHVGLYVLDVSGHGVAAALLAVIVQRFLSPMVTQDSLLRPPGGRGAGIERPARVAERLNRRIRSHLLPGQYLTLLYGVLDLRSFDFHFSSAGHWGPVHVPAARPSRLVHARGFPIGVMEEGDYEEDVVRLGPGDRLYLYSDGIPESDGPGGEQFDYLRLTEALDRARSRPLAESLTRLVRQVQRWHGSPRLEDDVSVLALEIAPDAEERTVERPRVVARTPRGRAAGALGA